MSLTVPEVAARTGYSPETIRRWIRAGRLRARKVGTQHVIDEADLAAVLETGGAREEPAAYVAAPPDDAVARLRRRIERDPRVLGGKPVIRGTRVSVELVLELAAAGWSQEDIVANYPQLEPDDVRACFAYAAAQLDDEWLRPGLASPSRS